MCSLQPPHRVNLSSPEKTVIVQLLKSSAALSVAPKHRELMRFNLKELSTTDEEQVKAVQAVKEEQARAVRAAKEKKSAEDAEHSGATPPAADGETAVKPGSENDKQQEPVAEPAEQAADAGEAEQREAAGPDAADG